MITQTVVNNVDVDQLLKTIEMVKDDPELARFQFRATGDWISGGLTRTTIQGFYGAKQEDASREAPFFVDSSEPPVLLGHNEAPNAVELILAGLTSCLSVGMVYNAAARGITIKKLGFALEGDLDLHGFLGLSDVIRPGYDHIRLTCKVESDASEEAIADLFEHVKKTSPVLDIIQNPVKVELTLES